MSPSADPLEKYRARVVYLLAAAGVVLLLPFAINDFIHGLWFLGCCLLSVIAILAVDAWALYRGRKAPVPWSLLLAMMMIGIARSLHTQGMVAIFWPFPAVVFFHFVLPRRVALLYSIATFVLITTLSAIYIGVPLTARLAVALVLTIVFSTIFTSIINELQLQLAEQATIDPLTGALNRRQLEPFLNEAIARHRRGGVPASLVMLDVDHFKAINDRHGHAAGDEVLKGVTALVRSRCRNVDRFFRIGGEEFVLLLPGMPAIEAERLAELLRQQIELTPMLERPVTVSVGVSELQSQDSMDEWLADADASLYDAKEQGRNRVVQRRLSGAVAAAHVD